MRSNHSVLVTSGAAVLAFIAIFLVYVSPGGPHFALAGPCFGGTAQDPYPKLITSKDEIEDPTEDGEEGVEPLVIEGDVAMGFHLFGYIYTIPETLPAGKDEVYVDADLSGLPDGLDVDFDPNDAPPDPNNGSFYTDLYVTYEPPVPSGIYHVQVEVYCHEMTTYYDLAIYVDSCPAAFQAAGAPTDPWPTGCSAGTPTPTPASGTPTPPVTATPTLSPTPTPVASPSANLIWGDSDCSGSITARDNQAILREILNQTSLMQTEPCPDIGEPITVDGDPGTWGDSDCSGQLSTRDNQGILRQVLGQGALSQTPPCPLVGDIAAVSAGQ